MHTIWNGLLKLAAAWAVARNDYQTAIANYETLRKRYEKTYGANSKQMAQVLYKLAFCYHHSGGADNFRYAILLYQRALNIVEEKAPSNDGLLAEIAKSTGDWYAQIANYALADAMYQKAMESIQRRYGQHDSALLSVIYARSSVLKLMGKKDEAATLDEQAAHIVEANRLLDAYRYPRGYTGF